MKLTKLMLSACVAAVAFVSCNKDGHTPEGPTVLKSVEVNIGNIVFTKGDAGDKINAGDAVKVKDIQLFLVDDSGNIHKGWDAAKTTEQSGYFSSLTTGSADSDGNYPVGTEAFAFHFVNPAVTKVVAVANIGSVQSFTSLTELKTALDELTIGSQQLQDNLTLYAESTLTKKADNHTTDTADGNAVENQVYTAEVTLTPRISRFEIDGFKVNYDTTTPEFGNVTFTQIGFVNYMSTASLTTGIASGTVVNPLSSYYTSTGPTNEAAIYDWFATKPTGTEAWTYDAINVETTPASPIGVLGTGNEVAYHFFAGDVVPTFFFQLTADGVPGFIYTKKLKDSTTGSEITAFEAGKIYRMNAGTTADGDGYVPVDPSVINTMERCLEVTVEVIPWKVVLVTPEF